MTTRDFLVIGGGIIGISIACELKKRHPDCKILLLEKENKCNLSASGRAGYCMPDFIIPQTV